MDKITFEDVLGSREAHNSQILARLRPGPDDEVALAQSPADADKGFCTHPLTRSELLHEIQGRPHNRLIPRCVITQSSGKKRIIDDAAIGAISLLP